MYLNNSLLPLHSNLNLILRQHDIQIPTLQIPRDRDRNVDIADGLSPFVGKLGLFGVFAGLAVLFFLFAGGGFGGGGGFFVGHFGFWFLVWVWMVKVRIECGGVV